MRGNSGLIKCSQVNIFKHFPGFKIKTFYISTIQHFAFAVQTKNPRKEAVEKVEKIFKNFSKNAK
jgi:hypothetical protein